MNNIRNHYNNLYRSEHNVFGRGEPPLLVKELLSLKKGGAVLDVGAGQGRNALYLAERGFSVTAIDVSDVAIEQIKDTTEKAEFEISVRKKDVRDISDHEFAAHNIVLFLYILHHLSDTDARTVIRRAQFAAVAGVIHGISSFTSEGDFYTENKVSRTQFYPNPGELKRLYESAGWNILAFREEVRSARQKHTNGSKMENLAAFLLAQK